MKSVIATELFHGISSLLILAIITYLYFSDFNERSIKGFSYATWKVNRANFLTGYFLTPSTNVTSECQFHYPSEKTIILRLDDVQAWAWNNVSINITETVLTRNMSITLAVIPEYINNDPLMKNYLISKLDDDRVEIAQHGTKHDYYEYQNLTESEAFELTSLGLNELRGIINTNPITFIPPYNAYNENTTEALSDLGFVIFSGNKDEYKFDGNMMLIGYTAETKLPNEQELVPNTQIIEVCKKSLQEKNICVVLIHPSDYASSDGVSLNETRYENFVTLLDELNNPKARSSTFRDLVRCEVQ